VTSIWIDAFHYDEWLRALNDPSLRAELRQASRVSSGQRSATSLFLGEALHRIGAMLPPYHATDRASISARASLLDALSRELRDALNLIEQDPRLAVSLAGVAALLREAERRSSTKARYLQALTAMYRRPRPAPGSVVDDEEVEGIHRRRLSLEGMRPGDILGALDPVCRASGAARVLTNLREEWLHALATEDFVPPFLIWLESR
jgi:hypothetical protein